MEDAFHRSGSRTAPTRLPARRGEALRSGGASPAPTCLPAPRERTRVRFPQSSVDGRTLIAGRSSRQGWCRARKAMERKGAEDRESTSPLPHRQPCCRPSGRRLGALKTACDGRGGAAGARGPSFLLASSLPRLDASLPRLLGGSKSSRRSRRAAGAACGRSLVHPHPAPATHDHRVGLLDGVAVRVHGDFAADAFETL